MTDLDIQEIFRKVFSEEDYRDSSRLHGPEFYTSEYDTQRVRLYGGLNGWGNWKDYLYDLYKLLSLLEQNNVTAHVTNFEVDSLDDVFYVDLELRDFTEFYEGKPV